jgi:hypothetical protein
MGKNKVKVTENQPGILLYRPEHKSGVLATIKDYYQRRKRQAGRVRQPIGSRHVACSSVPDGAELKIQADWTPATGLFKIKHKGAVF